MTDSKKLLDDDSTSMKNANKRTKRNKRRENVPELQSIFFGCLS